MFRRLKNIFCRFVIADPRDNSITFSKRLWREIERNLGDAKVLVFRQDGLYGFHVNPDSHNRETQLADIQYNAKHRTIGFESLVPTVNRIFYDYHLPHDKAFRLPVKKYTLPGITYYLIQRI